MYSTVAGSKTFLNADSETEESSTEDRHAAITVWWERNNEAFSQWFTNLSHEVQVSYLKTAIPDVPTQTAGVREQSGETLQATDVMLPELTLDGLLGANGQLLVLFFSRRCQQADKCYFSDVQLLNNLFLNKVMPLFSSELLDQMDTPFVDPADDQENVR